jgi:hypothetical protein
MADSGAVRQARYKRHQAGDHSICRHDRPLRLAPVVPVEVDPDFDPALEMRKLAGRLAVAYQADPGNAALARELRNTLLAIKASGDDDADDVAWQAFIDDLSTPSRPEGDCG